METPAEQCDGLIVTFFLATVEGVLPPRKFQIRCGKRSIRLVPADYPARHAPEPSGVCDPVSGRAGNIVKKRVSVSKLVVRWAPQV
jgi:hypothetical protein